MKSIFLAILIVLLIYVIAYPADTTKIIIVPKLDTVSLSTKIIPKAPTNWSRVKDLFL